MSGPRAKRDRGAWTSTPNAKRRTPGRAFNLDLELCDILDELRAAGVQLSPLAREALRRHPKIRAILAARRRAALTP